MSEDPTILIIDDEEEICSFLSDLLTREGYTAITANNPEEGLAKVEELRPDLVLLDLKMPRMDGVEVLRRIKTFDETIPVVIMTGYGTMDSAMAAMRLGAFDYITKPFDLAHVKALIKDALVHRIHDALGKVKPAEVLLSEEEAFLDSLPKCRPEGACLWEAAVRALLLGDAQFMRYWAEQTGIPAEDKKSLERLLHVLTDAIRRKRQ
jgi:DNA-binding NtrC family response regulator